MAFRSRSSLAVDRLGLGRRFVSASGTGISPTPTDRPPIAVKYVTYFTCRPIDYSGSSEQVTNACRAANHLLQRLTLTTPTTGYPGKLVGTAWQNMVGEASAIDGPMQEVNNLTTPNATELTSTTITTIKSADSTDPPSFGGINGTTSPSLGGINGTTPPSLGGINGTSPPSLGGINGTSPPSLGGINGTSPPSLGGINGTTPPSLGGINGTSPPSIGGINGTSPPSIGGINGTKPHAFGSINGTRPPIGTNPPRQKENIRPPAVVMFLDSMCTFHCRKLSFFTLTLRVEKFRKPTHTDQYLDFNSHHPLEQKLGVIRTLFHRADTIITSDEAKSKEHSHLKNALNKCGYRTWTFNKALQPTDKSKKPRSKPLDKKNTTNITIPYIEGVSEKLRRILQGFNIGTNFKPYSTLRQNLVHPKDRVQKGIKSEVIYRLKCEEPNCNDTYIGETSQPLKERYKQHCRATASGYSSAIYHHTKHNQGHSFKLEATDILDREPRWYERGVKEAIYERIYNPTLNRKEGGTAH
ncbi:hypothetical protein Bbelb_382300 [Branchiostoma belcheri]|nr:hypothetical protein Bbelb_382300 [Branchiostoma belcheri]